MLPCNHMEPAYDYSLEKLHSSRSPKLNIRLHHAAVTKPAPGNQSPLISTIPHKQPKKTSSPLDFTKCDTYTTELNQEIRLHCSKSHLPVTITTRPIHHKNGPNYNLDVSFTFPLLTSKTPSTALKEKKT